MSTLRKLTELGEALGATKKKLEQRALTGAYLRSLPASEVAIAARLLIGRVFPESDARVLNLSAAAVGRVLSEMSGAPIDWDAIGGAVDFGEAAEKWLELRGHKPRGKALQLAEVYRSYEALAQDSGAGSRERKDQQLLTLLRRATPLEAKYIVKHLVREMRVGVSEATVLDAVADTTGIPAAAIRRANQVSGDMGEVVRTALGEGEAGLAALSVKAGVPLKPMLAQSAETTAELFERMDGPFALEAKLDGARVQIHKQGDAVKLFSRQLSDITASLPEIVAAVREGLRAKEAILDGEVIAVAARSSAPSMDGASLEAGRTRGQGKAAASRTPAGAPPADSGERPLPFQDVMRRFGRERDIEAQQKEISVKLVLFDLLQANGKVCMDLPNERRWAQLQKIRGTVECVQRIVPESAAAADEFLRQVRAAGHEGVMAKQLASPYVPGERGRYWIKLKPVHTLDLVIVAADWGYGRRTGWLSNVHLAARDADTGEFFEVGKTFKGLTDAEFKTLTEQLLANKLSETRGTVRVKPEVVVEVAFNNVQTSPRYPGGVALRLARITNFRPDKPPEAIDTIQTLRALRDAERGAEGSTTAR